MSKAVCSFVVAMMFLPVSTGWAKDGKGSSRPAVQKFEEVERGFFVRTLMGGSVAINDMFGDDSESRIWPPGPVIALELGYDFGQVASMHLVAQGQQVDGNHVDDENLSVDASLLALMLGVRFNIMTTKRLGWFLKVQGGWMFTTPESVTEFESGLLVGGGTGIEYATMLRHFFIGLELGGSYDINNGGILVSIAPTLKYTF